MYIVILRHGNNINDKLTVLGKKQIKMISSQLKKYNFSKIFCSPKTRCVQSAQIIAKKLNLSYEACDELTERFQLGHRPQNKEEKLWWDNYLNLNFSDSKFEVCNQFYERNKNFFDYLLKNYKENVLIVAHSATAYAFANYFYGNQQDSLKRISIPEAGFVEFEI